MIRKDPFPDRPDLNLSTETLAFLVLKARAYEAEVPGVDPNSGSNASDDRAIDSLETSADNSTRRELRAMIDRLDEQQQAQLVALVWIARGDYEPEDWDEAVRMARSRRDGSVSRYLLGMPLLGDLIEEGADRFGVSLTHEEQIGMHHPVTETPAENDRD